MSALSSFPSLLSELHTYEFDYNDGDGIDFEPYDEFVIGEEALMWFRQWTNNPDAEGYDFAFFGQDGAGGRVGFWLTREKNKYDVLTQPIVYLGSEGEVGVVASNFSDYLWLLAQNHDAHGALFESDDMKSINFDFHEFALQYVKTPKKSVDEIVALAQREFPDFHNNINALLR